jgi:hypothetical protein
LTFLCHAGTDDIELRELLTLPSGTPSYRLPQAPPEPRLSGFASHPTLWAQCPLRPTDRPTSAALAAQTHAASCCSILRALLPLGYFGALTPLRHSSAATAARRPGPSRPRPDLQLRAASTDLCRYTLPRDQSFFGSLRLLPGCDWDRQFCLATPRQHRHKPLGRNGTELTWRPDSVLAALGFSPFEGFFPTGCTASVVATGDRGGHSFRAARRGSYLVYPCKRILGWRGICSR